MFSKFLVFWLSALSLHGATSVVNFSIAEIRDASGAVIADGGGTWAIIVSAIPGTASTTPTPGSLPGDLADNSSLAESNAAQAAADFDGVQLVEGTPLGKDFTIHQVGGFTSGNDLGLNGVVQTQIDFNIFESGSPNDPGYTEGTLWGFYWFPGKSFGDTTALSGSFQVGGFASSTANAASFGDFGTTIPTAAASKTTQFYESDFNQTVVGGNATGLAPARFTAIAVPEPSTLALAVLGMAALLRRRRG
jgi:hypothetical protein